MSTLTADPDLERLLHDHAERPCEIRVRFGPFVIDCANPAAWVMSGTCRARKQPRTRLVCDECKRGMTETRSIGCVVCDTDVTITRVEPLR